MKITKNTGILAAGTVVCLPGGELCEICEWVDSTERYRVEFLECDGDELVASGDERYMSPWELVGGEFDN